MKKPVLVIMAAGMGSRYGGLKQIDPVDAKGRIIMDFSIFDAKRAGFEKVIFIIKKEQEDLFREAVGDRVSEYMEVSYAYQEINNIPAGFQVPEGRVKPWGTAHAVYSCKDMIDGPFAVINADDYYGREAFQLIYDYLNSHEHHENGIAFTEDDGATWTHLDDDTTVSMNMWGFSKSILDEIEKGFPAFIEKGLKENPMKCEYYLPGVVSDLLGENRATVAVLKSADKWYGVTYKEDKPVVMEAIRKMEEEGLYPA